MNPYPLVGLNHFTVPVAMFISLHWRSREPIARISAMRQIRVLGRGLESGPKGNPPRPTKNLGEISCMIGAGMASIPVCGSEKDDIQALSGRPARRCGWVGVISAC